AYHFRLVLRFSGALQVEILCRAFDELVRRHEVLRTTFPEVDGEPVQVVGPPRHREPPVVDLRPLAAEDRQAAADRLIRAEGLLAFDLVRGPLLRLSLLRLGEQEHLVLLNMHHIISDGWSISVFVRELTALYEAFYRGEPPPLPELPIQYADFAAWQRQWLQGEKLAAHLDYWLEQLGGELPTLELPLDRPRPAVRTSRGASLAMTLPQELSEGLRELSRRRGVTLFMTLLAAFDVLLARTSGQDDLCVGSPIVGRTHAEVEGLIGFFLNALVLRADLAGTPTFLELLERVQKVCEGAYAHQDVPFERLLEELEPERDLSRTPLFQVFFNMLNMPSEELRLPGLQVDLLTPSEFPSRFDLEVYLTDTPAGIRTNWLYNPDLFDRRRMAEVLAQFESLLAQIVEGPDERIDRFSLVTPASKALLGDLGVELSAAWEGSVQAVFADWARRSPDAPAVADASGTWSYRELDVQGNRLAQYLRAHGIGPEDVVAVYGHRSAALAWAVLGVLKAGAAFLILDPESPVPRLVACLRRAAPRGWLQPAAAGALPAELAAAVAETAGCRLILPAIAAADSVPELRAGASVDPAVPVAPDSLAYVAFTSGSTGIPKGILGRHGSLSHFIPWQRERFALGPDDRFCMLSGLAHDPLQRDLFTPVQLGAQLAVPDPDAVAEPQRLAAWMRDEQITVAHLTPAMGQLLSSALAEDPGLRLPALRWALFVGDRLTRRDVTRLRELAPGVRCVNLYGSTETQRAVGYYPVAEGPEETTKETIPLGRGIADVELLVLDRRGDPAGIGELGEVAVRSPHLALGYLGDPRASAERFTPCALSRRDGERVYRTGDLGRYLPDGNLEYAGRADRQIKIRGFRIEPGEIEAALGEHQGVGQAVVVLRQERLVAYLVPQGSLPATDVLRSFLRSRLPDFMVPAAFVELAALPLTPNRKVDFQALPMPERARPEETGYVAPRDPQEQLLAAIWAEVLGIDRVGVHDNFFDAGGHSLL
ncbi:MAG: amino acid adenylation domain-containing protein, partial [bacterium]|nr:amino acid adenylation domain-containing protein [bacterium]